VARALRFYGKKRGNRRTDSRQFGRWGELIFFCVLLVVGIGGAAATLLTVVLPEWRVNHDFAAHRCRVLDARLAKKESDDGVVYRPEVLIEYTLDGRSYQTWTFDIAGAYTADRAAQEARLAAFVVDRQEPREYPCWYDPLDPSVVVVVRGYSWWLWPLSVVWGAFLLTGFGGLVYTGLHWGRSVEHRAVLSQRVSPGTLLGNGHAGGEFPFVPSDSDITNSPGTHLKYRLPIGNSPGWVLMAALIAAAVWNTVVAVMAVVAIRGLLRGSPDWPLVVFLIPSATIGLGLLAWFVRELLVTGAIGPTLVEISDHPLRPGGCYDLFVLQPGRLTFQQIAISLVCQEDATYRQGTNTRTESCEVVRQELLRREQVTLQSGAPLQVQCQFVVPESSMHSFKAPHNSISWKIVVEGSAVGWPQYRRTFHVVVVPRQRSRAT